MRRSKASVSGPISPLDGRYQSQVGVLPEIFSEQALMRRRCEVELRWLLALDELGVLPRLSGGEWEAVRRGLQSFGPRDFLGIKAHEARVRHDVKACELYLEGKLGLGKGGRVHFGLTSEDVNNLAYSLCLEEHRQRALLPKLSELCRALCERVRRWRDLPFPASTHGQPASPTTAGKELAVFVARLLRQYRQAVSHRFLGKLNGATGNWSALHAAFPEVDWIGVSRRFVESMGFVHNVATTQVEPHDSWGEYFDLCRRVNLIVLDLDVDVWLYVSREWLRQAAAAGEVGSSTMPHKVNPIRFENSEGNLSVANALLVMLSERLSRSRMQRDLSDSTVERNIGVALGHSWLGWSEAVAGLSGVELDPERCVEEISSHPELVAEPVQTLLRAHGVGEGYEKLRELTRGKRVTRRQMEVFLEGLEVPKELAARLRGVDVVRYVGLAPVVCDAVLAEAEEVLGR